MSSTGYLTPIPSDPPMPTGGGSDQVFYLNGMTVTSNYSIPSGQNALSTGPITVNAGITVTIPSGSKWVVL